MSPEIRERIMAQLDSLPDSVQEQVLRYVEHLAVAEPAAAQASWGFKWAGGLADLKPRFASGVELQHDTMKSWPNDAR